MNKNTDPGLAARIADVLNRQSEQLVERLVATYRGNPGYESLDRETLHRDLLPVATANIRLLTRRMRGVTYDPTDIAIISESAVRRYAQGVPQAEVMRAYRLWSMAIWNEITAIAADLEDVDPDELVRLAATVLEHNEYAGGLAADAYDAEEHGVWVPGAPLRGAVLAQFVTGTADPADLADLAASRFGPGGDDLALLLVTPRGNTDAVAASNVAVREVVDAWTRAANGRVLVAVDGRVVMLIGPVSEATSWSPPIPAARREAVAMAIQAGISSLTEAFSHYEELLEVLAVAESRPPTQRPLIWQDALLGSLLRDIPEPVRARLDACHRSLDDYEDRHNAPLLETLEVLLETGMRITGTAERLFCHPNTIRYRLRRIHALTGLDPALERDRLILRLALTYGKAEMPSNLGPDHMARLAEYRNDPREA